MDVYENCPVIENERFVMRLTTHEDCRQLLKVYSDEKAVELFNSDNCNGDHFHYQTMERMKQAIDFWIFSYQNRYFVRWTIIDKQSAEGIGTVELFRREADDAFTDTALLRVDVRSDYERPQELECLFGALLVPACDYFGCRTITTKAAPKAAVRREMLQKMGFVESDMPLRGHGGEQYRHYFVYEKRA